ncbi:hypothetical protein ABT324_16145 [Saccharopolyspora sp. NPDC000359]|uniref:hypothetical protein n=1 Tax=Saccharopolyspora sp. NPDC000359 TaxID=3154251 RepID=UPI0033286A29
MTTRAHTPPAAFTSTATIAGAVMMLVIGAWCRLDPTGFAAWANWPDHEHFLHDAGVFQVGIGLLMLTALVQRDALTVVLTGFVVVNTLHGVNHAVDTGGGHPSDPWILFGAAALGAVALLVRVRSTRHADEQEVQR